MQANLAFRIGRWLFFAVFISLLPVVLGALSAATRRGDGISTKAMVGNGELLIVSAAIVGAAIAELFALENQRYRLLRFLVGCFAATVVIAAATWFADIAAAVRDNAEVDHGAVAAGSLWLFGFALLSGLSCVVVAVVAVAEEQ